MWLRLSGSIAQHGVWVIESLVGFRTTATVFIRAVSLTIRYSATLNMYCILKTLHLTECPQQRSKLHAIHDSTSFTYLLSCVSTKLLSKTGRRPYWMLW